jgi:PAS domain S-box-containing protein
MNHPQPVPALPPESMAWEQIGTSPLALAVAAAGVGVWEIELPSGKEWWSDTTLAMYGLPPGSPAPTRTEWRELFLHPDDSERCRIRAEDFLATGRPYEMEYRIRRADDAAVRWLYSRSAFKFGSRQRVLGVTVDITERRVAEGRAREATAMLEHAARHVGFGFGVRELVGNLPGWWSPELKRLLGLPPDASTPNLAEALALFQPHDRERVRHFASEPIPPGELREFNFDVARPDGDLRTLTTRGRTEYDEQGRPQRTYFAIIDNTELLQHERRERELLEHLQLATEATGIGIWERDARSGQARWDTTMKRLWGLPPEAPEPVREQYLALLHPDDRDEMARYWARADEDRSPQELDFRVLLPGGSVRWLRTRGRVVLDDHGQPLRRIGVCFDTTERREAEAAQQARELAERANAAKTEFLSRMSHELRTPLNAVLGFAQLMALDSADPLSPTQRARVAHVQAAGWHLLSLVNDVLDLARIESRGAALTPADVDLDAVVQRCLAMAAPQAERLKVALRWAAAEGMPRTVWADETRLLQLLSNLVSNGLKYNRSGGEVEIGASTDGSWCWLRVRDTGMGLSQQQLQQLFQPFNRLGREHSGIEGSGLGLALCRQLAEQMGGTIEVSSTEGVGSEFRVRLPLRGPGPPEVVLG